MLAAARSPRDTDTSMSMVKRILLAAALSWVYSVTLGLVFAATLLGRLSLEPLALPGVIPVALLGSSIVAVAIAPLSMWALRAGARNLWTYGPALWVVLAAFAVAVAPKIGRYGPPALVLLVLSCIS